MLFYKYEEDNKNEDDKEIAFKRFKFYKDYTDASYARISVKDQMDRLMLFDN